jgi:hypothetical protein
MLMRNAYNWTPEISCAYIKVNVMMGLQESSNACILSCIDPMGIVMLNFRITTSLLVCASLALAAGNQAFASKKGDEEIKVVCPDKPNKPPKLPRKDTYKGMPFQAGEEAVYECTWADLRAGFATMSVAKPRKHQVKGGDRLWHRVFRLKAKTGKWFKTVFIAEENVEAISRPWDFGISKFYMSQNEGKFWGKAFEQKKWLEFDHDKCKVKEKIQPRGEKEIIAKFDFAPGGIDSLGVIYKIRTMDLVVGKKVRAPVYTSEKNWWLEVTPIKEETIKVPAGKFKAMKVQLQTYIGKDMQQKGDVFAWIGTEHKSRPLIQIEGEIKIGSVWLKLQKFKAGK